METVRRIDSSRTRILYGDGLEDGLKKKEPRKLTSHGSRTGSSRALQSALKPVKNLFPHAIPMDCAMLICEMERRP